MTQYPSAAPIDPAEIAQRIAASSTSDRAAYETCDRIGIALTAILNERARKAAESRR